MDVLITVPLVVMSGCVASLGALPLHRESCVVPCMQMELHGVSECRLRSRVYLLQGISLVGLNHCRTGLGLPRQPGSAFTFIFPARNFRAERSIFTEYFNDYRVKAKI